MFQLNNKHSFISALAVLVLFLGIACNKADTSGSDPENIKHPRILLFDGEEEQIKKIIQEDATWRKMHYAILDECIKITGEPLLEREMTGRRLLSVSRELLRRVFYLSYAYRMTGQVEYLIKAESEMLAVADFSDWNPSHFLDVAEMTMGMAIGYDWLFSGLKKESKEIIKEAILKKGICIAGFIDTFVIGGCWCN